MTLASLDPENKFGVEAWTLLGFAGLFVVLRCVARIQAIGLRKLKLDDWGMKVALILFGFTLSCVRLIAATTKVDATVNPNNLLIALNPALANNAMTDDYRASLDPASVEYQLRVAGSKLHLTAWSLYVSTLWCLKLCLAVFYTRLTAGLPHMKLRIHIAYVAIGVSYIVVMGIIFGACRPFNHYWQINPNPGDQCMPATSVLMCYVVVILNVLTDLYLLHIPIHILWDAQISRVKKFFLIMLFSGGVFVIMSGILRAYFILTGGRGGGAQAAYWGSREAFVAFVIGNVPMIYGGFRIWLRKVRDSKLFKRFWTTGKDWSGAGRFTALISTMRRSKVRSGSGKGPPKGKIPVVNMADMSYPSAEASRQPPMPWGNARPKSHVRTDIGRHEIPHSETDADFGIQVTRGIRFDVESVRSKDSDQGSGETGPHHGRTDSQARLGPFSGSSSNRERRSELPSDDRPIRRSILLFPSGEVPRRSDTPDGLNDTKWFHDDSA